MQHNLALEPTQASPAAMREGLRRALRAAGRAFAKLVEQAAPARLPNGASDLPPEIKYPSF